MWLGQLEAVNFGLHLHAFPSSKDGVTKRLHLTQNLQALPTRGSQTPSGLRSENLGGGDRRTAGVSREVLASRGNERLAKRAKRKRGNERSNQRPPRFDAPSASRFEWQDLFDVLLAFEPNPTRSAHVSGQTSSASSVFSSCARSGSSRYA